MTAPSMPGRSLEPSVMRLVALGMADGQINQADALLCLPPFAKTRGSRREANLVCALLHMRSACGWLRSAVSA